MAPTAALSVAPEQIVSNYFQGVGVNIKYVLDYCTFGRIMKGTVLLLGCHVPVVWGRA